MQRLTMLSALLAAIVAVGCGSKQVVGVVLPETGDASSYGASLKAGAKLAFDEAIAAGRVPRGLTVSYRDSGSSSARAADEAEALYRDGALVVLGGATSPEAKAMLRVAEKYGRVLLSPSASAPDLATAGGWFFRVYPSDDLEGAEAARFLATSRKVRNVLVVEEDVPYAQGLLPVFTSELTSQGGRIVHTIKTSDPDWKKRLSAALVNLRPEALYVCGYGDSILAAVGEVRHASWAGTVCTTSALNTAELLQRGGSAVDGVFFPMVSVDATSEQEPVQTFVKRFKAATHHVPDVYAAHGHDAALAVILGLEEPGVTSAAQLRSRLRSLGGRVGVTGPLAFDDSGNVVRKLRVHRVARGSVELFQPPTPATGS